MVKFLKFIVGAAVLLIIICVVIGAVGSQSTGPVQTSQTAQNAPATPQPAAQPAAPQVTIPPAEQTLANIVSTAQQNYGNAANDMQKGAVRHQRAQAICAQMTSTQAARWAGTIATLDSTDKGNGVLVISLNNGLSVGTTNNELSESVATMPSLIPASSPLFNKVSQMKVGDTVYFSGKFASSDTDCFEEDSLTTDGSVQSPQFLFQFSSVDEATGP